MLYIPKRSGIFNIDGKRKRFYAKNLSDVVTSSNPFLATFDGGNTTPLTLPLTALGTYDFYVDWGDGSPIDHITSYDQAERIHTYSSDDPFQISITGTMNGWNFQSVPTSATNLLSIGSWGNIVWEYLNGGFAGCTRLSSVAAGGNFTNVLNFTEAWVDCSSLTSFPALTFSAGTNFTGTWRGCISLTSFGAISVPLGTAFSHTWYECNSLTVFPSINFSSGTDFYNAWYDCASINRFLGYNIFRGFDLTSCNIDEIEQVDEIYTNLPTLTYPTTYTLTINSASNAGYVGSDTSIATAKGWIIA